MEAQMKASAAILEDQRALLISLRAAWVEVEKAADQASSPAPDAPEQAQATGGACKNWSA
jgi:hypothetical protein